MKSFLKIAILSYTLLLLSISTIKAQCNHPDDYTALRALYLSTNGDNWTTRWGWPDAAWFIANPTMPPGTNWNSWFGVIGGCSGGRVRVLEIIGNNLTGPLPPEITLMTGLNELKIYANTGMSGPIPTNIGNLTLLTELRLSDNSHNGTIPSSVGSLINLNSLSFSNNQITGVIPSTINNLNQLTLLALNDNNLSGLIPNLSGLTILRNLRLQFNSLTGNIPNWINNSNFTDFRQLRLDFNQLSGTIPSSLGSLNLMAEMRLNNNNLEGCIPEELQDVCPSIASFNGDISNNLLLSTQSWTNFCNNQEGMCGNCTVTPASNSPNVCINTNINITHTTTGATGIGTPSGLPSGITASWSSNVITINGAPISSGTFSYNIPLAGPAGCSNTSATGTIIVNPANTVGPPSSNPTVCLNSSMPIVTISTTGATGIGTPTGLPTGVSANWLGNNITISGMPLSLGVSNYTITLIGGCGNINASGTITVIGNNTATSQSSTDPICTNALMTNVTHATTGATGIGTPLGLPPGITASWFGNTIVISGTPTAQGTYNYSIPLTGGCGSISAAGVLNVTPVNSVSTPSSTPTLCVNSALTSITHTTSGATNIGTAIGLPQGINASWSNNTISISGIPSEAGTFNYSIALTGGCGNVNATGTIFVTPLNTVSSPPLLETCVGENMNDVFITTTGATDIDAPSGLPLGLSAWWNNNTITLSGTPLEAGTFNYSIPLLGGCGTINANGTIIVNDINTASPPTLNPQICLGNDIPTISINTTGASGIGTPSGLPPGVTASFNINNNTITISGTPTSSDNFDYEIPLVGGCGEVKVQGIITVYDLPKITIEIQPLSGFLDPNGYTCKGSKFKLTAYGGALDDATWKNGMPNGSEITISENMDFEVSITDVNGCENDTTFSIFVYDTLSYTLTPLNLKLCSDTIITFNPQQSVTNLKFILEVD